MHQRPMSVRPSQDGRYCVDGHKRPNPFGPAKCEKSAERCGKPNGTIIGSDGRKHEAGTALFADGEGIGVARAIWIAPRAS